MGRKRERDMWRFRRCGLVVFHSILLSFLFLFFVFFDELEVEVERLSYAFTSKAAG